MARTARTASSKLLSILTASLLASLESVKALFIANQLRPANFLKQASCSRHHEFCPSRVVDLRASRRWLSVTNENDDRFESSHEDSVVDFEKDVAKVLNELRPEPLDTTIPAVFRSKSLSFTRLWNLVDWDRHTSRWRYGRYLTGLSKSRLLRRILPQLIVLTIWSCCAVVLRTRNMVVDIPLTSISLVSSVVAALLTLRSNQGLARLADARAAFGKSVLYTRDAAQMIASSVYPKDKGTALIMIRHLSLFVWLLKSHLRDSPEEDIVRTMIPDLQDADYILSHRKPPVAVLSKLRQCVARLVEEGVLHAADHMELEDHLVELDHAIMTTERLRASPIPPLYTSHTGRLLLVNLFLLPLALTTPNPFIQTGKVVPVVVTTVLVGFAMFGLDEISHTLEQPFRLMPLYQTSKLAMIDVSDALVCLPPQLSLVSPSMVDRSDNPIRTINDMGVEKSLPRTGTSATSRPVYW